MMETSAIYGNILAQHCAAADAIPLRSDAGVAIAGGAGAFEIYSVGNDQNNIETSTLISRLQQNTYAMLEQMAASGIVRFSTSENDSLVTLVPFAAGFSLSFRIPDFSAVYKVSRFAYICSEGGAVSIKSPRAFSDLIVQSPRVLSAFYLLSTGCKPGDFISLFEEKDRTEALLVLTFLCHSNIALVCDSNTNTVEETNAALMQWDFHDLLVHARSRVGRTADHLGGTFRFKGILPPQPAVKPKNYPIINTVALPRPISLPCLFLNDSLSSVIETRTSVRKHGTLPISALQLSAFLFQVCRVRNAYTHDGAEYIGCPYPNGGGSYEHEFYLTVHRCDGIAPGFYHYDPIFHALEQLRQPSPETEQILRDASNATLTADVPQIVITIASRFQKVSWKYKGIAYAAQLKHIGVVYAHMYLVATAMGLAPCALGSGNTDLFCKLAGTDYYEEGSIGEFMLGSK